MRWTLILALFVVGCDEGQPVADYPESEWQAVLDEMHDAFADLEAKVEQLESQVHDEKYAGVVYEVDADMPEGCVVNGLKYIRTGIYVEGYSLIFSQTWGDDGSDFEEWELERVAFANNCDQAFVIADVLVVDGEIQLWDEANTGGWDSGEVVVIQLTNHGGS